MADYKFSKNKKMLKKSEYQDTFLAKNFLRGKFYQIVYQETNNQGKLGLAIAKKHHKLAVQRNRIKRIAREVFRHSKINNFNIVVLSNKFKSANNNELFTDLSHLFLKLK